MLLLYSKNPSELALSMQYRGKAFDDVKKNLFFIPMCPRRYLTNGSDVTGPCSIKGCAEIFHKTFLRKATKKSDHFRPFDERVSCTPVIEAL